MFQERHDLTSCYPNYLTRNTIIEAITAHQPILWVAKELSKYAISLFDWNDSFAVDLQVTLKGLVKDLT